MSIVLGPLVHLLAVVLMTLTSVLHSYALAIIVLTLLLRCCLTPLMVRQLAMQKKAAALEPELEGIRQRWQDKPMELLKEQRELHRRAGISQRSTIALLFVQAPLFLALLLVFQQLAGPHLPAIYHQTFLWFRLDQPDHLFGLFGPLSLLPGALQWVQQRMTMGIQGDSLGQVRLMVDALSFLVILVALRNPASLALSYVTSTLYGIGVQWAVGGVSSVSAVFSTRPISASSAPHLAGRISADTRGDSTLALRKAKIGRRRRGRGRL
jgi:YidC/Oxa1 family membrane protein insertase